MEKHMAKIKVISNPYLPQIKFQKWIEEDDNWQDITLESNPNGKLVKDDIRSGFFPFIVKKIVDTIVEEYYDDENAITIVFEGTGDEYKEMNSVCNEAEYNGKILLLRSEQYLENARDILPEIRDIYKQVEPLIKMSVLNEKEQLEREQRKFSDASSDQIPVCILGNYSTGKSSFINALIGLELLPSGDEPITGKIYKIVDSKSKDRAYIKFDESEGKVEIRFDDEDSRIVRGQVGSSTNIELMRLLDEQKGKPIIVRLSTALQFIEKYIKDHGNDCIGDLIELSVPFGRGLWRESANNFVIFDTPGSNSASNIDHVRVLKKAMEDMSNGMPIFVSEYNSLDSTDNEKLYKEIKSMKELDSRFTMIIVNKADAADLEEEPGKIGLPESREKRLLNLAIPKNLYGEGVFFVSSIMGLGTKINGSFADKHYLRVFAQNKSIFSDPQNELYQRLYRYNIMPEQLKTKAIEDAEEQQDLIYTNSGVYSVEKEIQTFADKYSSYNKCFQSEQFLNKLIDLTETEIDQSKKKREATKERLIKQLDIDKQALMDKIHSSKAESTHEYIEIYPEKMQDTIQALIQQSIEESLDDEKEEYTKLQEEALKLEDYINSADEAGSAIFKNLRDGIKQAFVDKDIKRVKIVGVGLFDDVLKAQEENEELENIRKQARENADDMIIDKKNNDYRIYSINALNTIDDASKLYWDNKSADIKGLLSKIVTGSSALTLERREELSNIIINYTNIDFEFAGEDIFDKNKFKKGFFLGKMALWSSTELNLNKLRDAYNKEIKANIEKTYESVKQSHQNSFEKWIDNLETIIIENIVEFNPELHSQSEVIKEETKLIDELENRQKALANYRMDIAEKMQWKTI